MKKVIGKVITFWGSRDLNMDSLDHLFAGSTTNQQSNMNADDLFHLAYKAIIGRINYDYQSKYLAEIQFFVLMGHQRMLPVSVGDFFRQALLAGVYLKNHS